MTAQEILQLIQRDADSFHLAAADALPAFAEILAELAEGISADDLTTLIAIGSVLHREADNVRCSRSGLLSGDTGGDWPTYG